MTLKIFLGQLKFVAQFRFCAQSSFQAVSCGNFHVKICLPSSWSSLFPFHAPALIPLSLSCQGAALAHLDSPPS